MSFSMKLSSGYDSAFDDDTNERKKREKYISDLNDRASTNEQQSKGGSYLSESGSLARAQNKLNFCSYVQRLNAYERHKMLINQYFFTNERAFSSLVRDTSRDVTDADILRENHKFLWEASEDLDDWGKRLAKKYYDKLFKEYCICDLSLYKQDKVGMRWRIEKEVKSGKGQFACSEKKCEENSNLRTWEMNFAYIENKEKKNALVKLRLCHACSYKLNYKSKKKQVKRFKTKRKVITTQVNDEEKCTVEEEEKIETDQSVWKEAIASVSEAKQQDNEFEKYLEDLFL